MKIAKNELTTNEVAVMLGVKVCTVSWWCRSGFIKYQDISDMGSNIPRYVFDVEEVNRVSQLRTKYGRSWINHIERPEAVESKPVEAENMYYGITNPEDYIPDNTDEVVSDIKKLRALKVQRDKLLAEVDSIQKAIDDLKAKVVDSL